MNSAMPLPFLLCCGASVKEAGPQMSYLGHKYIKEIPEKTVIDLDYCIACDAWLRERVCCGYVCVETLFLQSPLK